MLKGMAQVIPNRTPAIMNRGEMGNPIRGSRATIRKNSTAGQVRISSIKASIQTLTPSISRSEK
ncbi:MAG: hypothetical protein CMI18_08215 [Opitutaceae bacterium]|nr:hypothetical protein [Opitutaceae bacterium]